METVFNEIKHSVKNWWTSLLLGIVYIIVALWLMFSPLSSYVALSIVFSISMLISGILEIIFSLSNRKGVPSWGWYLVGGIIDLILGIYLIAYPMVSMEVIPFIIAFWLMFRGFPLPAIPSTSNVTAPVTGAGIWPSVSSPSSVLSSYCGNRQ